jgi:CelD/BcsL family acetyltransferase involved in cellulose biosynthesis
MEDESVRFDIVNDVDAFRALQPEWDALWKAARGASYQSFTFCNAALSAETSRERGRLHCIVGRRNGNLVALWPMMTSRRFLWKVATPLAPPNRAPNDVLIAPVADASLIAAAAWRTMLKSTRADVVELWRLRTDSALHHCIMGDTGLSRSGVEITSFVEMPAHSDWSEFCQTRPGRSRLRPDYVYRRLSTKGQLRIEIIEDDHDRALSMIDWLLTHKRHWAQRGGIESRWLFTEECRRFLIGLFPLHDFPLHNNTENPFRIVVLTLNGSPLAVNIMAVQDTCVELFMTTYDVSYAKFAPGTVLVDDCVKWAFEHGRDFDFGPGPEAYKQFWSGGYAYETANLQIVPTQWGRAGFAMKHAAAWMRARLAAMRRPRVDSERHGGSNERPTGTASAD